METQAAPKTTPLYEKHLKLRARMAPFAGWDMPIQYEGIIAETLQTRTSASVFDTCHMGEFLIRGDLKRSHLDRIVCGRIDNLGLGSCRYSSMLNDNGGVIDDLLVYRKGAETWLIVVNAGTIEGDKEHFLTNLSGDAEFSDQSRSVGKIDLQGPLARDILRPFIPDAAKLGYYTFVETNILGEKNIVSRTGYTGELGFEIYASTDKIREVWDTLLKDKRVKPAGLGSRDVLRLEMGFSLYGQDMDGTVTPLEAGLERFVDFGKDFIGKGALLKQKKNGPARHRIFFKTLTRRSPRHGHKIYADGQETGTVTSGTFSPHLTCGIGMGFVRAPIAVGHKIALGDGTLRLEAVVCSRPFMEKTSLRN